MKYNNLSIKYFYLNTIKLTIMKYSKFLIVFAFGLASFSSFAQSNLLNAKTPN